MPSHALRHLAPVLLTGVALSAAPALVRADTILTFGPAVVCGTGVLQAPAGSPLGYTESGFRITSAAELVSWCTGSANFAGSALVINGFLVGASLSAVDNSTFSIASIDLANLFAASAIPGTLSFTGHFLGGGVVTQTFNFGLPATTPPVFSTFSFNPAFSNLVSFDFAPQGTSFSGTPNYQFTNVRLNATSVTPEPASLLLAGTGLIGLAVGARARKRRARQLLEYADHRVTTR